MSKTNDYTKVIETVYKEIEKIFKVCKSWEQEDAKIVQLYALLREAVYQQVHNVLVPQKTEESEKQIRDILAKYVIGYTEKKKSVSFIGALSPIRAKLIQMNKNKRARNEYLARYLELYDDFMALASFRSLKHFALYMQQVFNFTLWEDTLNCFEGYWYYAGRMVLDKEVKFIEKQCPTGYGKSVSDAFLQAFIFGYNIDSRVFKVCGNDKITDDCFNNVVSLMISPQFAKVFPYYAQFNGEINKMFEFCARKDLIFKIRGSVQAKNLIICTKLSDTNGIRADYLFMDDITQRRDMSNLGRHQSDIHSFHHEWYERKAKDGEFQIVASGTTYSQFDLLSYLKRKGGGENAVKSPVNKYTSLAKSDLVVEGGLSVFVCVPLLDYDTDESTYPKKITTTKARKKREEHPEEFWAMDMQKPMPPDSSPFYFTKLRQYTTLPAIGECGRLETCVAALDTKRRGKDFLSMPIFFEAADPDHQGETAHYLVDWLYDDRSMKECIPLIVSKIIQRKITRLYVERNTEECIETLLQDKLKEQGYTSCVIEEVYSTEPKDRRIMSAEGDIKAKMIFPQYNMYAPSNDVGKALLNVYGYRYNGKVEHDDAPDSLALYAKRFIMGNGIKLAEISIFMR
jgi:predicted phage terminase large subunit-like protein